MECSKAEVYLSKWADNELDKNKIIEVSDHLKDCKECMSFSRDLFFMADKLSKLPLAAPSSLVLNKSLSIFNKNRETPGFLTWWRFAAPEMKAFALSLVVAGILMGFISAQKTMNIDSGNTHSPYFLAVNSSSGGLY